MSHGRRTPRRVFLSHTAELQQHPAKESFVTAAVDAVIHAGDAVTDMAYFGARDEQPAAVCRDEVEKAGVLVLIAGFCYGTPVRGEPHHSYTELEFEAATALEMPRLVFLLDEDSPYIDELPVDETHAGRQLDFRDRLRDDAGLVVATFSTPENLTTEILKALWHLNWRRSVVSLPPPRGDEVERRREAAELTAALLDPGTTTVGITGAGGFGKSTLALMGARHEATAQAFPDGRWWVRLSEDTTNEGLAGAISSLSRLLDPDLPHLTDPLLAGAQLGRAMGDGRMLLVVDDVWTSAQIEPFLLGGDHVVRLFTTRRRDILPIGAASVLIDRMTDDEAAELLTGSLPVSTDVTAATRDACGAWPLLLALVHDAAAEVEPGDAEQQMIRYLTELRADRITGLDVHDPDQRRRAVERTMAVSLDHLAPGERDRYVELAVFGKDVRVPFDVVARLWEHTGAVAGGSTAADGWAEFRSHRFCQRLFNLSLLADYRRNPDSILLHNVIGAYLRHLTADRRPDLHRWMRNSTRCGRLRDGCSGRSPIRARPVWKPTCYFRPRTRDRHRRSRSGSAAG